MRFYGILLAFTLMIMLTGSLIWPEIHPYMGYVKTHLIGFNNFCHHNPLLGYILYGSLLALILFFGLPFSVAVMLLAGITYRFWEATLLVTSCRLVVALAAFLLVRHMMNVSTTPPKPQPALLRKFERHPRIGLLLARLSPLPDTTVNLAMGASSLDCMQYVAISLIGMIPLTIACVWIGNELGSVTQLIKVLN